MSVVKISIVVLGLIGFAFSLLLAFLSKRLKAGGDPRVEEVLKILPGLNCGACGFSGCRAYAEAVVEKEDIFAGCLPGGRKVNQRIAGAVGIKKEIASGGRSAVFCRCGAAPSEKTRSALYFGPMSCRAAHLVSGAIDCVYGCLELGDCVAACPLKAITLRAGKIYVDSKRCVGCGKCIKVCPRNLFETVPREKITPTAYYVACRNKEKGKEVRKVCKRGCIGCGICVKVECSPFYLKDSLAHLDYEKAKETAAQEEAKRRCPTKCIDSQDTDQKSKLKD